MNGGKIILLGALVLIAYLGASGRLVGVWQDLFGGSKSVVKKTSVKK